MEPRIDGPISPCGMGRIGFPRKNILRVRRGLAGGRADGSHCGYAWIRQMGIPCARSRTCSRASRIT